MTREAVADLLAAADYPDHVGRTIKNLAAALLMASAEVLAWECQERALEAGERDLPLVWANPADDRAPFAWLRGRGVDRDSLIGIYQDDGMFGLCFSPAVEPQLPASDEGSLRSRRDVPVVKGRINKVEVVFDTSVEDYSGSGPVTEALLHGDTSSTLLSAAAADSMVKWHRYDESVVVVSDVAAADALDWIPPRQTWRPTEVPGR